MTSTKGRWGLLSCGLCFVNILFWCFTCFQCSTLFLWLVYYISTMPGKRSDNKNVLWSTSRSKCAVVSLLDKIYVLGLLCSRQSVASVGRQLNVNESNHLGYAKRKIIFVNLCMDLIWKVLEWFQWFVTNQRGKWKCVITHHSEYIQAYKL